MRKILIALLVALVLIPTVPPVVYAGGLEKDKAQHIGACTAAELTLAQMKPFKRWKPWQRILFTTAVIGGGKEWYDARHPENHDASWGDIAADAVGASAGESMIWIIHKSF